MSNFHILHALCRSALANPSNAVIRQVERLRDALEKEGKKADAEKLTRLLNSIDQTCDMAPYRIQKSRAMLGGEELTPNTSIPVDKETATPLVEILFPASLCDESPIFSSKVTLAVKSILDDWANLEKLSEIGASPSRSCLIYGAPGTGKTHLALWMAQQMGIPVVLARLDGLMSSFLGTTSRNIGNLFTFAAKYKCILLLDEFDAIAKLRDDPQEVGEIKRVVNTLLQNLDARRESGICIGITNHEVLLDPAIWRRFDVQIEIPIPSYEVVSRIIGKFMAPLDFSNEEIKFLAWCIEGGTGADAISLVQWIKKMHVLEKGENTRLADLLQKYALLNSKRIAPAKREMLAHPEDALLAALLENREYGFRQKDVADIMGFTPSAVSKRLTKLKGMEEDKNHA
ncbi:MAG: AAA family ATPase [Gammaproteobacteria bacterium]|nr:AAA family ATPase [Gammaproteobacteria bacterium]